MGIVKDVKELLDDPRLKARGMVVEVDHPRLGKVKTFNLPIKFFNNRGRTTRRKPKSRGWAAQQRAIKKLPGQDRCRDR
jgi:crotonobetainyl-CoA:carnitine CoA-transferase CaiB-like acyl-CoA transferase